MKIILGALALMSGSAMAQSSTATMGTTGTVAAGCLFGAANYTVDFGTVYQATVAKAQTNIEVLCTSGLAYSINSPSSGGQSSHSATNTTVTAFSDAARTVRISGGTGVSRTGTGTLELVPIYFRMNSTMGGTVFVAADGAAIAGNPGTHTSVQSFTVTF